MKTFDLGINVAKIMLLAALLLLLLLTQASFVMQGQAAGPGKEDPKPFGMPFAGEPSPDTWLFIQPYGNTFFAYQYRSSVYFGGQGLHFGVDLAAACGTPILAIGDGVVESVDSWHGAGPHNLMITHANGYDSFYGHLLVRPRLRIGQVVEKGEVVALSGDPDLTCNSRPHLHLEIRDSATQGIAYNPLELIDADWERIALAGSQPVEFVQELGEPRMWLGLFDQPETKFGYPLVNNFSRAWPYDW
jgi:murein DD-endopeptidase MepM/ murein hydrolase activator NlpD